MSSFSIVISLIVMLTAGSVVTFVALSRTSMNRDRQFMLGALAVCLTLPAALFLGNTLWVSPASRATPIILVPWSISLLVLLAIAWKLWPASGSAAGQEKKVRDAE